MAQGNQERKEEIPLLKLLEAITPYQAGIYVTVLNIIQCIALAFLINEIREAAVEGEISLILMARSAVAITIILVIWHRYVSESQYLWPMSWWDTIIPFAMGISECAVVFSANPKTPVSWFLGFIVITEAIGAVAYGHARSKRKADITKTLYQSVYADWPLFAFRLSRFLIEYDERNLVRFVVLSIVSFLFFVMTWLHNFHAYEFAFPAFYVFALLHGEISDSFHRAMMSDISLRPYFQHKEKIQ